MLAQRRMTEDMCGTEHDLFKSIQRSGVVEAFADWTVWWLAISMAILNASLSFGVYFPTLAATMGYNPTITLLLCAPPWILGLATSFIVMRFVRGIFNVRCLNTFFRHSDASGDRFWHVTGPVSMGIVGFVIAILTMNTAIRYLSLWVEQPLRLFCVTHVVQIFHGPIYSRIRCVIGVGEQLDT